MPVLEFPEVNDRISLDHTILGTDVSRGDLTEIWTYIERESAASPGESRDLIRRILAGLTAA